jgi:nitroreductase
MPLGADFRAPETGTTRRSIVNHVKAGEGAGGNLELPFWPIPLHRPNACRGRRFDKGIPEGLFEKMPDGLANSIERHQTRHMDTITAIQTRRSIKHFDASHQMPEAEVRQLIELTMQAPTAFNIQHWRFVLVRDPEVRKQIRAVAWDQAQVTDASLLVILCARVDAWKDQPGQYWVNAPQPVQDFLVPAIAQYYEGREQTQRDECMRSCGLAGQTLMLAAKAMGYDSCPMDGFDFDKVAEIIRLPENHLISFMVAIGKGTAEAWPKPGQLSYDAVTRVNAF